MPRDHKFIAALGRELIRNWGRSATSVSSIITTDKDAGPSNWGNVKGWGDIREDQVRYKGKSGHLIIFSVNEYNALKAAGVDMSFYVP